MAVSYIVLLGDFKEKEVIPLYGQFYQGSPPGIQGVRAVNGLQEVEKCIIPFGSKAMFMDKENDIFYIKETDPLGYSPPVEAYRFEKIERPAPQQYVTKQEFDSLSQQLREQYESVIQHLKQTIPATESNPANKSTNTIYENDNSRASESSSGKVDSGEWDITGGF